LQSISFKRTDATQKGKSKLPQKREKSVVLTQKSNVLANSKSSCRQKKRASHQQIAAQENLLYTIQNYISCIFYFLEIHEP
jgi:hypothetical protein